MRPVMQTRRGGADVPVDERGNCWAACLASVLEVGLAAVDTPRGDEWWERSCAAVDALGYELVQVHPWCAPKRAFWIAQVPSLNPAHDGGMPLGHSVVMEGERLAHDPATGYAVGTDLRYLLVIDAFVLVAVSR